MSIQKLMITIACSSILAGSALAVMQKAGGWEINMTGENNGETLPPVQNHFCLADSVYILASLQKDAASAPEACQVTLDEADKKVTMTANCTYPDRKMASTVEYIQISEDEIQVFTKLVAEKDKEKEEVNIKEIRKFLSAECTAESAPALTATENKEKTEAPAADSKKATEPVPASAPEKK